MFRGDFWPKMILMEKSQNDKNLHGHRVKRNTGQVYEKSLGIPPLFVAQNPPLTKRLYE
jgi:hypothetical protein